MVWKIFSTTHDVPIYEVYISENNKRCLTILINNPLINKKRKIYETNEREVKESLSEIFKLDVEQFREIVKHLNQKYKVYANALIKSEIESCEQRIAFEEYNLETLKGEKGKDIERQRKFAQIIIQEIQDELKKLMDKVKKPDV